MAAPTEKKPRDEAGQAKSGRGDGAPKNGVAGGDAPGGLGLRGSARLDGVSDEAVESVSLNREVKEQAGELEGRRKKLQGGQ